MTTDRNRFLILHGFNAESFARRHGIEPFSLPCFECGRELRTTLPFICGSLRGLISPICECGHNSPPFCMVRANEDLLGGAL